MNSRLRVLALVSLSLLTLSGLSACYEMGDIQDIAACQAFAAAQTAYDTSANDAMAHPDDKAKQVQWLGSWTLFSSGIDAASKIPTTQSLKTLLSTYAKTVTDAGLGASPSTQISIWKSGMATKTVKLCNELAAPITITNLNVK